ncbi:hypothetical protein VTN77DRAFT_3669 [Rasamsonia byssochlamydoides]|uniref:uncharacterized protein n=1 Tax=Rasamsonia byssochlamydoides TaxID=89139 RepID=UPI0037420BCA
MFKSKFSLNSIIIPSPVVNSVNHDNDNANANVHEHSPIRESPLSPATSSPGTPMDVDFPHLETNSQAKGGMPPKPRTPLPWTWTCHWCGHEYRLGVTRRCLRDGHYFCPGRMYDRKGKRYCRSEFDFAGWIETNAWRREIRELKEEEQNKMKMMKRPFWARRPKPQPRGNCWEDCAYPSACHHGDAVVYFRSGGGGDSSSSSDEMEWQPARKVRKVW